MHDYTHDAAMLTDFYQFTMAEAYFANQRHLDRAVFHIFFRRYPFGNKFVIAAGIADAINFISKFHLSHESIEYFSSLKNDLQQPIFSREFLTELKNLRPHVSVSGVHDGDVVFAYEPILRIEGPIYLCQLLESAVLNIINFQSLIATKASRIVAAAQGRSIIDFGLRRAQGFDGAISASKAAFIGGVHKTSNCWAAQHLGLSPSGTMAHSFVMSYKNQAQAFLDYCLSTRHSSVLLIDTYDPLVGLKDAIEVLQKIKQHGIKPIGIRIDSGDLVHVSKIARTQLNQAGLSECQIAVSGDLDEYEITRLLEHDAPIDVFGVGTHMIVAYDDPALSGVYKLASVFQDGAWRATEKRADAQKISLPGHQAIARFFTDDHYSHDVIFNPLTTNYLSSTLLHENLLIEGKAIIQLNLINAQERAKKSLAQLPSYCRNLKPDDQAFPVYFDDGKTKRLLCYVAKEE